MGHLNHLKAEYEGLVDRLGRGTVALPEPQDEKAHEGWKAILEILFTPEEAELARHIPIIPANLETICKRSGLDAETCEARLNAMADKGLVMDLVHSKSGRTKYLLSPPVVGFFEFSLMRAGDKIPQDQISKAMDAYMHGDPAFAREAFSGETVLGRTLLSESLVDPSEMPDVLDWEKTQKLIEGSKSIAVSFCYCRHKKEHLGTQCDAPTEVCLSLNGGADFVLRRKFGRSISKETALEIIADSRKRGLVQIADNVQNRPTYICNCCGCCCGQLSAINEYDLNAVNPSGFQPNLDDTICKGCSKCSRACPIGAISMVPSRQEGQRKNRLTPTINFDRCIGCGLCSEACKPQKDSKALKMRRLSMPHVPSDGVEKALRQAIEHGRLADLLFDHGAGMGQQFLNRAMNILTHLPGVEQTLAKRQVQSRFIKFFLQKVNKGQRSKAN